MFNKDIFGETIKTAIQVEFIHYIDGHLIEEDKIPQEHLPEDFSSDQYAVTINNKDWMVVKAVPHHADQYSLDKKLKLWLKDPVDAMLKKDSPDPSNRAITFGIKKPGES
jgi:hypothetical protein